MPTACTNGTQVFFHFGAYGLLALDAETSTLNDLSVLLYAPIEAG